MQNKKASQLRMKWGDKPCSHKVLEKEYYLGAQTDDYVCKKCGKEFSTQGYNDLVEKRSKTGNK